MTFAEELARLAAEAVEDAAGLGKVSATLEQVTQGYDGATQTRTSVSSVVASVSALRVDLPREGRRMNAEYHVPAPPAGVAELVKDRRLQLRQGAEVWLVTAVDAAQNGAFARLRCEREG